MLSTRKIYEKIRKFGRNLCYFIVEQTWLSYSLTEQHLKNKKTNNPHFTDPNNVVKLIQLNI